MWRPPTDTTTFACAALLSFSWSEQRGVSLSIESAQARIGRPLTRPKWRSRLGAASLILVVSFTPAPPLAPGDGERALGARALSALHVEVNGRLWLNVNRFEPLTYAGKSWRQRVFAAGYPRKRTAPRPHRLVLPEPALGRGVEYRCCLLSGRPGHSIRQRRDLAQVLLLSPSLATAAIRSNKGGTKTGT